jgi:hypothetical protein
MRDSNTILVVVASIAALTGCASTKRISLASTEPASAAAIVRADWQMLGRKLSVEKIDGLQVRESSWQMPFITEAEIPPGVHTIEVSFNEGNIKSISNVVLRLDAQPSGTYQIHAAELPEGFWSELGKAFIGGTGRWTAWVVDTNTGQVVAGTPPPGGS